MPGSKVSGPPSGLQIFGDDGVSTCRSELDRQRDRSRRRSGHDHAGRRLAVRRRCARSACRGRRSGRRGGGGGRPARAPELPGHPEPPTRRSPPSDSARSRRWCCTRSTTNSRRRRCTTPTPPLTDRGPLRLPPRRRKRSSLPARERTPHFQSGGPDHAAISREGEGRDPLRVRARNGEAAGAPHREVPDATLTGWGPAPCPQCRAPSSTAVRLARARPPRSPARAVRGGRRPVRRPAPSSSSEKNVARSLSRRSAPRRRGACRGIPPGSPPRVDADRRPPPGAAPRR